MAFRPPTHPQAYRDSDDGAMAKEMEEAVEKDGPFLLEAVVSQSVGRQIRGSHTSLIDYESSL